jgi:uncharacterized DUF497 family protein
VIEIRDWEGSCLNKIFLLEEVLAGDCGFFKKETDKVEGEHLYNALGRTNNGRYLSGFFVRKLSNKALIVTARDMTKSERKIYEKSKHEKDMSIYEASEFWDKHDFSEFEDVQEVKDIRFSLIKKKYIGVDIDLFK